MGITAVIIAHDQLELVQQEIKVLELFGEIQKDKIIIIDNASSDGTAEWLQEQMELSYIVYDEGIERYGKILNDVVREWKIQDDLLILWPQYAVLPHALQKMQKILHGEVGAVSSNTIKCDLGQNMDYVKAVDLAQERENIYYEHEKLEMNPGLVLISAAMIKNNGSFDERMYLPTSVMLDYFFRGLTKGNKYLCEMGSYFFEMGEADYYRDKYGKDIDRSVLKEKWGMNYFNNHPNENLITYIQEESMQSFNVLEVGCDCGVNLLAIKNQYPNVKLYGVEINESAAKIASYLADVQVGNIEEKTLDFQGEKFDYIVFGDVLEHLRDPAGTIEYCKKLLKPEGYIVACIPNLMHFSVMHQILNGDFTYSDMGLLDRTHIHFFTYNEIVRMFASCNYDITSMDCIIGGMEIPEEEKQFVAKLVALTNTTQPFMYNTFQYLVKAKMR